MKVEAGAHFRRCRAEFQPAPHDYMQEHRGSSAYNCEKAVNSARSATPYIALVREYAIWFPRRLHDAQKRTDKLSVALLLRRRRERSTSRECSFSAARICRARMARRQVDTHYQHLPAPPLAISSRPHAIRDGAFSIRDVDMPPCVGRDDARKCSRRRKTR